MPFAWSVVNTPELGTLPPIGVPSIAPPLISALADVILPSTLILAVPIVPEYTSLKQLLLV